MDEALDALRDVVAWIVTATIAGIATWVGWITRTVMANKTRLAVLEETVTKTIPDGMSELKDTLREMRAEARDGRERLYGHMDNVRLELKEDIKDSRG